MFCSISGEAPEEPVLCSKSGRIYDKHNILKYMESNENKDPFSLEAIQPEDLIPIKVEKNIRPRPTTATSIPGLLHLFQNEWDAVMLECFTLKQQLESVRQELSHALYQHDAACRVIARLIKERDEARSTLGQLRANPAFQGTAGNETMEVETALPEGVKAKIQTKSQELSSERKKRTVSETLATAEDLKDYVPLSSHPVHKSSDPGVLCLALHPNQQRIMTGGADTNAVVFDRSTKKIAATLSGHSKKVVDVAFHPTKDLLFTCSADKTAKIWAPGDSGYTCSYTMKEHTGEVTGISLHPTGEFLATASLDSSWALHDIVHPQILSQITTEAGVSAINIHPDGVLVGTGLQSSAVQIWDLKALKNVATFEGHKGRIVDLHFSENGYYLATAGQDNTVKLWDLRKLKNFHTLDLPGDFHLNSVNLITAEITLLSLDLIFEFIKEGPLAMYQLFPNTLQR